MNKPSAAGTNVSLIIGIAIPVLMVLFIGISINFPRWFSDVTPPQFDFVYLSGRETPYSRWSVGDGRLQRKETPKPENYAGGVEEDIRFFVHDVSENKSREIQEDEAISLNLNASMISSDGFTMKHGRRGGWFFFDYRTDYRTRYLVKDNFSTKLDLINNSSASPYQNIRFLGWIEN